MQKSRILRILGSFSEEEMSVLNSFLRINYHKDKNPEELLALFELINKHHPELSHSDLNKEEAFKIVYNNIDWIPGKIDKLLSRLLKSVYQFIGIHFSATQINPQATICKFLLDRDLKSIFDRELNKWSKDLESKHLQSSEVLYEHFLMKEMIVDNQGQNIHPKINLELPELLKGLDQFYILTKLKYACQMLAIHAFLLRVDFQDSLKSFEYLSQMMDLPHLQTPIISVYAHAYKMLSSKIELNDENFNNFKLSLEKHGSKISDEQQKSLNALIRNYAIQQYMEGKENYLLNAFEVYKSHLEQGFLYHQGKIAPLPLRNIATFGLRLKKYDWVLQFLTEHKDKIAGSESPHLIYNFNLALYYIHIKEYEKALNILPQDFDNYYYKMGVKRLELIIYHDTDSPILDSKIDAFKVYIYRIPESKITKKHKVANNNFIHLLKQIRHPKTEHNPARIEKLKSKIHTIERLAEKEWLIEKLNDMIN